MENYARVAPAYPVAKTKNVELAFSVTKDPAYLVVVTTKRAVKGRSARNESVSLGVEKTRSAARQRSVWKTAAWEAVETIRAAPRLPSVREIAALPLSVTKSALVPVDRSVRGEDAPPARKTVPVEQEGSASREPVRRGVATTKAAVRV